MTHPIHIEASADQFESAPGSSSAAAGAERSEMTDCGVTLAAARDCARRWGGELIVEAHGGPLDAAADAAVGTDGEGVAVVVACDAPAGAPHPRRR